MVESSLSSTRLNEIQNHDDFKVIWFCSDENIPNELNNIKDYLEKCHSLEECVEHLTKVQSERKILLVLIHLFEYAAYFDDFPQIQSIYVLERNSQDVQYEKEKHSKLIGIFSDERILIERLRQDILLTYRNDLPISISCLYDMTIEQSLTSFDRNTLMFLWNHVFTYYLVNSPDIDMKELKNNMIEQCRLEYKNNPTELIKIESFRNNCTYDNVISWYTRDSFVYKLVNRAFRTRNIDLICKFRYFIILLYNKLKELSVEQQGEHYTTVYRGQFMKENEIESLKSSVGCLISINTITSTTRIKEIARSFVPGTSNKVIFKIDIVNTNNKTFFPFADIAELGSMTHEKEVLFFPGAVFRIDSVKEEEDSTWIIELTLKNETFKELEQIMIGFEKHLNSVVQWQQFFMKTDDINLFKKYYRILTNKSLSWIDLTTTMRDVNVNYLIDNIGNPEKMIEHYKNLLLNQNFIDNPKFIVFNILIGNNYFRLFQYDDALLHYAIAFSFLDDQNWLTGELYNHIGDVWTSKNNLTIALSCYNQALTILHTYHNKGRYFARIYRKISYIYQNQNNSSDAIVYEERANQIDTDYRQRSDFDLEISLKYYQNQLNNNVNLSSHQRADHFYAIGIYFIRKGDYSQALKNLLQAKQLFMDNLPPYNRFAEKFGTLYESMAMAYILLKDNFNGLAMWKRAIDIRTSFL